SEFRDRDPLGLLERLFQQRVRLLRRLLRLEVIRGLVVERAGELFVLDESGDIDRLARPERELVEIRVVQLDVVAFLVLVSLDDVAPRDFVVAFDAPALVLDAAAVLGTEQIKRHLARAFRREIEPDRDGDHPKAHDPSPDGSWHSTPRRPRFRSVFPARRSRANCKGSGQGSAGGARRPTSTRRRRRSRVRGSPRQCSRTTSWSVVASTRRSAKAAAIARSARAGGSDPVEAMASWNARRAARSAAPRLASQRVRMSMISSIPVR